ncbi:hypothetical protein FVEN_g5514 [Fusarium venenatum]|uniref:MalT-like TPR region domain-containing protein n=1 Tax=Fusarium venenatum TaxID=56646 RepID=A0A2L2TVF2_9HYPO|nr:uncharacterized protein FVRRES_08393 [Fusarium venenatum]KAG8356727.1 hypothetical protein FVEN_g5514 [Fusarium venenatum]KAH6965176.1 hypothetical protein EDB82DRAFT_511753 [Fusarium venenatum]CEI68316.1 unnamed protein product [Fusarium venenatum]
MGWRDFFKRRLTTRSKQTGFSFSASSVKRFNDTGTGSEHLFDILLICSSTSNSALAPSLSAAEHFFSICKIPYRISSITLDEREICQDGRESFDETVRRLQSFIESSRLKGLKRTQSFSKSDTSTTPHLIILADTLGSILIRGVALKFCSGAPTNTRLMVFFQESNFPYERQFLDDKYYEEIYASVGEIITEFDYRVLEDISPDLNRAIWLSTRRRDPAAIKCNNKIFRHLLKTALEETLDRIESGLKKHATSTYASGSAADAFFTQPQQYKDFLAIQPAPPSSTEQHLKNHHDSIEGVQRIKSPARRVQMTTTGRILVQPPQPPLIAIPETRSNVGKSALHPSKAVRNGPSNDAWKDLRDQAEARLESGDNKYALLMFDECLRMAIPYDTAIWEIKSSLAFARMMLGHYVKAEQDLRQLQEELGNFIAEYKPEPTITHIHGTVLLYYALALLRLGRYSDMDRCLREIVLVDEHEKSSKKPLREQQKSHTFSASVCRLRALAAAQLGKFTSQTINDELRNADRWCEKLGDVQSSEPVRISNVLNKCRISTLRGHYAVALSMLQPELMTTISEIGETDILTIEVALLCSFLHIETGHISEGRLICERYANVIEEILGNEHPLALEAEHILITASHQEGNFFNALDDSISLCRRSGSNVNLGHKHPSTLKYKTQLGTLYIECGLYSSAEDLLKTAVEDSHHPETLKGCTQLALAQYHLGKLDMAEKTIFKALYGYFLHYLRFDKDKLWLESDSSKSIRQFLNDSPLLHGVQQAFKAAKPDCARHPDILYSLLTCAKIVSREPRTDLGLALRILRLVRDAAMNMFGQFHTLALQASLTMGGILSKSAMRDVDDVGGQEHCSEAISSFDFILQPSTVPLHSTTCFVEESDLFLDSDHPILLGARQERVLLNILFSPPEAGIEHVLDGKDELNAILTAQRNRLGPYHRQTVKTQTTILSLEVSFSTPSPDVKDIFKDIVGPLASGDAEQERFLECLLLRERVAGIVRDRQELLGDDFKDLLGHIRSQIKKGEDMEDLSIRGAVKRVRQRTNSMMRDL